jgi:hypothetical protein
MMFTPLSPFGPVEWYRHPEVRAPWAMELRRLGHLSKTLMRGNGPDRVNACDIRLALKRAEAETKP